MNVFYIVIILCSIIEILAIIFYSKYLKRFRLIFNTETSRITTLKKGFYEIKGKVTFLEQKLISPLAQIPCVYYKFEVEEQRGNGKNSHWHTVIKDEKYIRFGVQDSSGIAYIEPKGAKLLLVKDDKGSTGLFKKATDELKTAMNKYGKTTKGWIFDKTLRYEETYLSKDDDVIVLGEVSEMEGYYPVFKKGNHPYLISDKSEESLLKISKKIFQAALLFMVAIPVGLLVYLMYYFGHFS